MQERMHFFFVHVICVYVLDMYTYDMNEDNDNYSPFRNTLGTHKEH
jgi:hypothetical protein